MFVQKADHPSSISICGHLENVGKWEVRGITLRCECMVPGARGTRHSPCIHCYNLATMHSLAMCQPIGNPPLVSLRGWWWLAPLSSVTPLSRPVLPQCSCEHWGRGRWVSVFLVSCVNGLILPSKIRIARNVMWVFNIKNLHTSESYGCQVWELTF